MAFSGHGGAHRPDRDDLVHFTRPDSASIDDFAARTFKS